MLWFSSRVVVCCLLGRCGGVGCRHVNSVAIDRNPDDPDNDFPFVPIETTPIIIYPIATECATQFFVWVILISSVRRSSKHLHLSCVALFCVMWVWSLPYHNYLEKRERYIVENRSIQHSTLQRSKKSSVSIFEFWAAGRHRSRRISTYIRRYHTQDGSECEEESIVGRSGLSSYTVKVGLLQQAERQNAGSKWRGHCFSPEYGCDGP